MNNIASGRNKFFCHHPSKITSFYFLLKDSHCSWEDCFLAMDAMRADIGLQVLFNQKIKGIERKTCEKTLN